MPENVSRIEPCLLTALSPELGDVIAQLPAAAQSLEASMNASTARSLAELVRVMNCYYSNLIEGHNTRPRDIARALENKLDSDPVRRNLQIEARAHIRLQREIDQLHGAGKLGKPTSPDFVRWLHRKFYEEATPAMLTVEGKTLVPGEWRSHDVAVGRHVPPSSERLPEFMDYFAGQYDLERLGVSNRLVAVAAAHHRFNFIHPFLDGNGRVSRLMSHAMGLEIGIGAHGLWSISRGLARGLESRLEYMARMDAADAPREGDLDGRGNLSERRLSEFVTWFLSVCLDQVKFMSSLFELEQLQPRLIQWARAQAMKPEAGRVLEEILRHGELERGHAAALTRLPERTARDLLVALQKRGIVASDTPKGPLSLRFDLDNAEALLPKLFPEA